MRRICVGLSMVEIGLLEEALDSHEYWHLSEPCYRSSRAVLGAGSNDAQAVREIRRVRRLAERLHAAAAAGPQG